MFTLRIYQIIFTQTEITTDKKTVVHYYVMFKLDEHNALLSSLKQLIIKNVHLRNYL